MQRILEYLAALNEEPPRRHSRNRWPEPDAMLIAGVLATPKTVEDLKAASPVKLDPQQRHTDKILAELFPRDALICIGRTLKFCKVRRLRDWEDLPEASPFMVPSPMTATKGFTQKGKLSSRCLDNTGPRWHVVVEFDKTATKDEQATKLLHLAEFAPLVAVQDSGGKSLHGWFRCKDVPEELAFAFMRYAVRLGADYKTWTRCQLVRIPDGTRDDGNRQTAYYFDPDAAQGDVMARWHIPPEWLSHELPQEQEDCTHDTHVPPDTHVPHVPPDTHAVLLLVPSPALTLSNDVEIVAACLPSKEHDTNDKLFDLSRGCLTLERLLGRNVEVADRTTLFELWWSTVPPAFLTKPKGAYFLEFMANCEAAKVPLGQISLTEAYHRVCTNPLPPLPEVVTATEDKRFILLAALCHELQLMAGDNPFFLSTRNVAELQGHPHPSTPSNWLRALESMGVIKRVRQGTFIGRDAAEFRYLGPLTAIDSAAGSE